MLGHLIFCMHQASPIVLLSLSVMNLFVCMIIWDFTALIAEYWHFVASLSNYWAFVCRLHCGLHDQFFKCQYSNYGTRTRELYHTHEFLSESAAPFYEPLGSIGELKCGFKKQTVHAKLSGTQPCDSD